MSLDSRRLIREAVRGKIGLMPVTIPERKYPLWLRCGSGDAAVCVRSLELEESGLEIAFAPRNILEIGAGNGYRSVALAVAFPGAMVVATEGRPAAHRIHLLNTLPYRNVVSLGIAVSNISRKYAYGGRRGHSGTIELMEDAEGPIVGRPFAELLKLPAWQNFDTLVVTPDAASEALLTDPATVWPATLRLIAIEVPVEVPGKAGQPGLAPAIAEGFPEAVYARRDAGRYALFYRREVYSPAPALPAVFLVDAAADLRPLQLRNVSPDPWGFFAIGNHGFRLHPNEPYEPTAQVTFTKHNRGYTKFMARLQVGNPAAGAVRFRIAIVTEAGELEIMAAEEVVGGGAFSEVAVELPPCFGECRVIFSTEMADPGVGNGYAWAEVLDPRFL
jgi:hypothetical protein